MSRTQSLQQHTIEKYVQDCIDQSFSLETIHNTCTQHKQNDNRRIFNNHETICDDKSIKIYNKNGELEYFFYLASGLQNQVTTKSK